MQILYRIVDEILHFTRFVYYMVIGTLCFCAAWAMMFGGGV